MRIEEKHERGYAPWSGCGTGGIWTSVVECWAIKNMQRKLNRKVEQCTVRSASIDV